MSHISTTTHFVPFFPGLVIHLLRLLLFWYAFLLRDSMQGGISSFLAAPNTVMGTALGKVKKLLHNNSLLHSLY